MPTELRWNYREGSGGGEGRWRDNHHYYVASSITRLSASRQFPGVALVTVITYDSCFRPDTGQNYSKGTKREARSEMEVEAVSVIFDL
ncbi:hypothetical protein ALC56_12104 [Trachymyrmex septentrionalis]|uniref:Uncharacterized protein n=1 Tax=Trachymyrmex septentrionalis TaxID=34720 RepID=A0A195EZQ3_9HYME|nr:hypothetical protein ALC56_12104 [Trachymyrmex septentrionalis]